MRSNLSLRNFTIKIHLGPTFEEQQQPQIVAIDIDIFFKALPQACFTDELFHTICYDDLVQKITTFCTDKSFHLIEYFGYQLYNFLKEILNAITAPTTTTDLRLSIKKVPPIANLSEAIFTLDDSNLN